MTSRPSDLQSGPYHTELSDFLLRWKIANVKNAAALAYAQAVSTPDILVRVSCKAAKEIDEVIYFVGSLAERSQRAKPGQVDVLMEELESIHSSVDLIKRLRKGITIELNNGSGICVCLDKEAPITKETL